MRVPDELARACPGEVTHVVRFENPGLRIAVPSCFVRQRFLWRHDEHRLVGGAGLRSACSRCSAVRTAGLVLQFAGGRHDVISRNGNLNLVVTKFECELTRAQELLVLPADVVGVSRQARKPLREEINIGVAFREVIVAAASADDGFLDNVE